MLGDDDLRAVLAGGRTDGKRLSAHMRDTAHSPWLPSLPDTVEEFDLMHKSLLEHEAACVEVLETALATALERLAAARQSLEAAERERARLSAALFDSFSFGNARVRHPDMFEDIETDDTLGIARVRAALKEKHDG